MPTTRRVITYPNSSLDAIGAYWLARRFGRRLFTGIENAPIVFVPQGSIDSEAAARMEAAGDILLGIGGGDFDEHAVNGKPRKQGKCSMTLMAKRLGIDEDPALRRILKFVLNEDLNAGTGEWSLAGLVKTLNRYCRTNPEKVFEVVLTILDAKYWEHGQFVEADLGEFDQKASCRSFRLTGGCMLHLATIESGNELIVRVGFSRGANVVMVRRPTGNVGIFPKKSAGFDMKRVAMQLRIRDRQLRGFTDRLPEEVLMGEASVEGGPWYLHPTGEFVLNGSPKATDVPPTKIPLEEIEGVLVRNIRLQSRPEQAPSQADVSSTKT